MCLPGYFMVGGSCEACFVGTYKSSYGPDSCSLCKGNSDTRNLLGSNSGAACICKVGYEQRDGLTCTPCPKQTFWQSAGERGRHWLCIELPEVCSVQALEILVHAGGVAFIPKKIEVQMGDNVELLRTISTTETTTYGWTALIPVKKQLPGR